MKKRLNAFIAIIVLISINSFVSAQMPGTNYPGGGQRPTDGVLKGIVKIKSGEVVEYATVSLYSLRDSSLVTGTITKTDGSFELTDLNYGRFYAEVSFVGFDKTVIKDITLRPPTTSVDLGEIMIIPLTRSIDEVEVVADRPSVEYKIDKKIVSVSQDITAAGGTAVDVLENVPSVQTDIEGNITVRGSSNFTVYIDGRPSILQGSDALQQIPASAIENIEIITNPSAKYDAEGTAGIINVVMKKRKGQGVNGIINTSVGTNGKYGTDFLLNYRAEKFNIYGGLDYSKRTFLMEMNSHELRFDESYPDTLERTIESKVENERNGFGAKLGVDYYLNDKSTISISGGYDIRNHNREPVSYRTDIYHDTTTRFYTKDYGRGNSNNYELNIDYITKFNTNGHELTTSFNLNGETGGSDEGLNEYIIGNEDSSTIYNANDDNPEHEIRMKVDYVNPFSEFGKFEAGLQVDLEHADYDYVFSEYDVDRDEFIPIDSLSQSDLVIDNNVYSAYALFTNRLFWKIDYQLGLRAEYTDREVIADKKYPVNKLDFFPSAHISKKFNDQNQIMVNYTRRIRRPREWALNPIMRYMNTVTLRQGNPELEPEYTDSYELNYQYSFNRSFVSTEIYHRHGTNLIERNRRTENGKTIMSDLNVGESFSTGLELMGNLVIKQIIVLNASYSVFNYKLNSPIRNSELNNQDISWRTNFNATVNVPWKGRLQLGGFYNASSITSQGEREGYFVANAGYRQDFFDRRLTATIQARDLFSSMNFKEITYENEAIIDSEFRREAPVFTLTLSYKINNYKTRDRERNGEQNGENGGGPESGGEDMF